MSDPVVDGDPWSDLLRGARARRRADSPPRCACRSADARRRLSLPRAPHARRAGIVRRVRRSGGAGVLQPVARDAEDRRRQPRQLLPEREPRRPAHLQDQRHARHRALPGVQHEGRRLRRRPVGLPPTGFIDSTTLAIGPDGRFELIVSATPHEGNWLPMTEATSMLIVRQTFLDRPTERRAELRSRAIRRPSRRSPSTRRPSPAARQRRALRRGHGARLRRLGRWLRRASEHAAASRSAALSRRRRRSDDPLLPRVLSARGRTRPWSSRCHACRRARAGISRSTITGWSRSTIATTAPT